MAVDGHHRPWLDGVEHPLRLVFRRIAEVIVNLRFSSFSLGIAQAAGLALRSLVRRFILRRGEDFALAVSSSNSCLSITIRSVRFR